MSKSIYEQILENNKNRMDMSELKILYQYLIDFHLNKVDVILEIDFEQDYEIKKMDTNQLDLFIIRGFLPNDSKMIMREYINCFFIENNSLYAKFQDPIYSFVKGLG